MKTIIFPTEDCIRAAAERLLSQVERKMDSVLAFGAGDDELRVQRTAVSLAKERGIPLHGVRVFAGCEFEGIASDDPHSARSRITEAFFSGSDAQVRNLHVPDPADPEAFDDLLCRSGGIDLAVVSVGVNARVLFNEPATQFDSNSHIQKLTDKTRQELAPSFGDIEMVPRRGVTMGFQQICFARDILVIALGEVKSKAVFHMLYGRDDSVYPAAFLQLPPNVTVFADSDAAVRLGEKGFDLVALYGK